MTLLRQFLFLIGITILTLPTALSGDPVEVLNAFEASPAQPNRMLIEASDGLLYGTTSSAFSNGAGTIFRMDFDSNIEVLHYFKGGSIAIHGTGPASALVEGSNGEFYGSTYHGGEFGLGTVYKFSLHDGYQTLRSLGDVEDGFWPQSGLLKASDGSFFGTAPHGGKFGEGVIYRIDKNDQYSVFHHFKDGKGTAPLAALIEAHDGHFYGTTQRGGNKNQGTIFKISPEGELTLLHHFDGQGKISHARLVEASDGNLYGTTSCVFTGSPGSIFRITSEGQFTLLHTFDPFEGFCSESTLVEYNDGFLYGTTSRGGDQSNVHFGAGALFRLSLDGEFETIHQFKSSPSPYYPHSGLIEASDGALYGTARLGGENDVGALFKFTPSEGVTTHHDFGWPKDSIQWVVSLRESLSQDRLFGISERGGEFNHGTLFELSFSGELKILHSFNELQGPQFRDGIVETDEGELYGISSEGGAAKRGSLYKLDRFGEYKLVHNFTGPEGTYPSKLIRTQDGKIFGLTTEDGAPLGEPTNLAFGTLFSVEDDTVIPLHRFKGRDGAEPIELIEGDDGVLYGTTIYGGTFDDDFEDGDGTLFKFDPEAGFQSLLSFSHYPSTGRSQGKWPFQLMKPIDGDLFGITSGGAWSDGNVFKFNESDGLSPVFDFDPNQSAGVSLYPNGILKAPDDFAFIGTTARGGRYGYGMIYKLEPNGTFNRIHSFNGWDGSGPNGLMITNSDGSIYGTTNFGGPLGGGVFYKLELESVEDPGFAFIRGDCNGDRDTNGVTDALVMLEANFTGAFIPPCDAACDANADGDITGVSDAVTMLTYNFLGGIEISHPFPLCASSNQEYDLELGCRESPCE